MGFKDQRLSDLDIFFNTQELAHDAVYTPFGGIATSVKVIVDLQENLAGASAGQRAVADFWVRADSIPNPKFKDEILWNGNTWFVETITPGNADGLVFGLRARKDSRVKVV